MNKERVAKGFDFLAPFYDTLLTFTFGKSIKKAQTHFFSSLEKAETILVFGGGSGFILQKLLKVNHVKKIIYIDISPEMISRARKLVKNNSKIEFIVGSYTDVPKGIIVDAVITPFVLDCFSDDELGRVIKKLGSHLKPSGIWLFSDFNKTNNKFNDLIICFLYSFFNLFCKFETNQLPDFKRGFLNNGLQEKEVAFFLNKLIISVILSPKK